MVRAIPFSEENEECFKKHKDVNVCGLMNSLADEWRKKTYPNEINYVPVEQEMMKSLIQIYKSKLVNTSLLPGENQTPFQNEFQKAQESGLKFSEGQAEIDQKITSEMQDFFYPDDFRISGNTKGEIILLDKWNNKLTFILDQFSEFCLEWEADRKKRESEALGKRNENYWKDVKRIEARRKFLEDFANAHLDGEAKKLQKIQEEQDVKLQILLKEFSKIDKRGLQLIELIQKSKDKQRRIKLTKELTELKNTRSELVQKILASDSNYTFKRFEW